MGVNIYNNRMHSDSKKRRSFLALLFVAGDAWRSRRLRRRLCGGNGANRGVLNRKQVWVLKMAA